MSEQGNQAKVHIKFEYSGAPLKFSTYGDFVGWVRDEIAWWTDINKVFISEDTFEEEAGTHLEESLGKLEERVSQVERFLDIKDEASKSAIIRKGALDLLAAEVVEFYAPPNPCRRFLPKSRERRLLLSPLKSKSDNMAASAWLFLTTSNEITRNAEMMYGVIEAKLFLFEHFQFQTRAEHAWKAIKQESINELEGVKEKFKSEIGTLLHKAEDDIDSLKQGYKEDLRLRAPVEYWRNKRRRHRRYAVQTTWALIGTISLLGGLYWTFSYEMMSSYFPSDPPLYLYGLLAAIGLVLIWIVRIEVRLLLSHIHLSTDAAERQVLIQTYLAMLKTSDTHAIEARELILNAIFRSANDGLISSDTMPSTPTVKQYFQSLAGKDF